jgi:hypothetical protein
VEQSQDSRHWTIHVTRQDESGRPLSGIEFDAQVLGAAEIGTELQVEEVGLGRYQVQVPIESAESLSLRLRDRDFDKSTVLHYNRPYPAEYRLAAQPARCLEAVPRLNPSDVRQDLLPLRSRRPISHVCYLAALVVMVTGLWLRRI